MSNPEITEQVVMAYGSKRKFRQAMRSKIWTAGQIVRTLDTLREFLPASEDIHDAKILLDRIQMHLSQKKWGK